MIWIAGYRTELNDRSNFLQQKKTLTHNYRNLHKTLSFKIIFRSCHLKYELLRRSYLGAKFLIKITTDNRTFSVEIDWETQPFPKRLNVFFEAIQRFHTLTIRRFSSLPNVFQLHLSHQFLSPSLRAFSSTFLSVFYLLTTLVAFYQQKLSKLSTKKR